MKVAHAEQHVLGTGGLGEAQAFKIRTSAHAFKILSSGLYSDKIGAVLREIGCNARDAHIQQGIGHKPFLVKLPNQIDNQFYIRDWGPGLSHAEVMELYTTYFASTKQDSNDFTGAFGLGSKSPFSYTDSFTVTSCHDGRKRVYTAHIGDKGAPVVALMHEEDAPADWQHGIEVGFPVKPMDFREFGDKAQRIFEHFTPLPNIEGGKAITPIKYKEDFGSYAFVEKNHFLERDVHVTMGCVRYPLNERQLEAATKDLELANRGLGFDGLILRFELGDLQVAASREELQYDPATVNKIAEQLGIVVKDMLKRLVGAYNTAVAGTWKDMCKFQDLKRTISDGMTVGEKLLVAAGYKSKALHEACESSYFKLPELPTKGAYLSFLEEDEGAPTFRLKVNRPRSATGRTYIPYNPEYTFVHGDAPHGYGRIRMAMKAGTLTGKIAAILPIKGDFGTKADTDALLALMTSRMKGLPIIDVSTLPEPPKIKISRRKGAVNKLPEVMVDFDGKQVQCDSVPPERRVFMQCSTTSSWGRHRTKWFIGTDPIDSHAKNTIDQNLGIIQKEIPKCGLVQPVGITRQSFISGRFRLRTDWQDFKAHVAERLADQSNLDTLEKVTGQEKYTVSLGYNPSNGSGLIENLVLLRHHHATAIKSAESVMRKFKLYDVVERVYKDSAAANGSHNYGYGYEPKVLRAYKELASQLGIEIKTPAYKRATLDLEEDYSVANEVPFEVLRVVAQRAPKLFPRFLETVLMKGTDE